MSKLPGMLNVLACLGMVSAGLGIGIRPVTAQLLYPPVSEQRAISVTGQGRASVPADQAQINVLLVNEDFSPDYFPPEAELPEESAYPPAPEPITRDSLQGVSDALADLGISESDIQINVSTSGSSPYSYVRSDASITVNIRQPTQSQINGIVQAINGAVANHAPQQAIFVNNIYVQYAIDSCIAIEQQAYAAAMDDARLRALAIADTINVALIDPPSVAELPFLGRFLSPCNEDTDIVGALFWSQESSYYNPETPAEVEVYREVLVTYPVEAK
ncbi:MAG: SIMPL domain-containing protein [Cyanobacteria bacterium]|nr:SIMPL domain-containing protein [Cyanobacteriota bacterium]MDA0867658.1 SIMPL domain-containing protein [Cyanobacteriota bacterium]